MTKIDEFITATLGSGGLMNFNGEDEIREYFTRERFPDVPKITAIAERAVYLWVDELENACIFRHLCKQSCVGCPYRVGRKGLVDANIIGHRTSDETVQEIVRFLWELEDDD